MLQPKKTKFRRQQKGRQKGNAQRGNQLAFGSFGIKALETDARKEEASVNSMEEENRRKKVDWLEERLTQRDEKIDGLYIELRKEQEEKIDWIHKCHEVELIQKESEVKKCEIRGCVKRMPPSDY